VPARISTRETGAPVPADRPIVLHRELLCGVWVPGVALGEGLNGNGTLE